MFIFILEAATGILAYLYETMVRFWFSDENYSWSIISLVHIIRRRWLSFYWFYCTEDIFVLLLHWIMTFAEPNLKLMKSWVQESGLWNFVPESLRQMSDLKFRKIWKTHLFNLKYCFRFLHKFRKLVKFMIWWLDELSMIFFPVNPLQPTAIRKLLEIIGRVRLYPSCSFATALDSDINQTTGSGGHLSMWENLCMHAAVWLACRPAEKR